MLGSGPTASRYHPAATYARAVVSVTGSLKFLSEAGDDDAYFGLVREQINPPLVARFTIEGEPMSKARARHTKSGHTYSPEANRRAEAAVAKAFRGSTGGGQPDAEFSFGVVALFFSSTRQRRDVDNMLKLVLDGLNRVAWVDDSQVSEISGRKELIYEVEDARTEVAVYRRGPIPRRLGKCEHCGNQFPEYRSQKGRRFCSMACDLERRRIRRTKPCEACGVDFEGKRVTRFCSVSCKNAGRVKVLDCAQCGTQFEQWGSWAPLGAALCSRGCRVDYWRARPPLLRTGTCSACGGPTSRKQAVRCRPCVAAVAPERSRGPAVKR